jgi:CTP-dependent riboflavin kinase
MDRVLLDRSAIDHWLFDDTKKLGMFLYLLIIVMDADSRHIQVKWRRLTNRWRVSERDAKSFMKELEKDGLLAYENIGKEVSITVFDSHLVIIPESTKED